MRLASSSKRLSRYNVIVVPIGMEGGFGGNSCVQQDFFNEFYKMCGLSG